MVSIYRMTEQRQKFLGVFYLKLPADHARFYRFTELVDVAQNPSFAFSQEIYLKPKTDPLRFRQPILLILVDFIIPRRDVRLTVAHPETD